MAEDVSAEVEWMTREELEELILRQNEIIRHSGHIEGIITGNLRRRLSAGGEGS